MAAIIRQWETVVRLLGRIDASSASPGSTDTQELCALVEAIKGQPAAPKAVWKKLVQQKVPLRLLQACVQQLQSLDRPNYAAAMAAEAAGVLIDAAGAAGVVHVHTQGLQALSGSALSAALLLQLQQSGLLEQLPAVLSATTQQLQRFAEAAEAGQLDAGSGAAMYSMLMALLSLAYQLLPLPSQLNNGVAFVPLPAVSGLVLSILRFLTRAAAAAEAAGQWQQQHTWQTQVPQLLGMVKCTVRMLLLNMSVRLEVFIVTKCHTDIGSSSSSSAAAPQMAAAAIAAVEEVLCSEECFLCLAVSTVALALPSTATQLLDDVGCRGGSSCGSSGNSSGNSSGSSGRGGNSGSNSGGVNASRQAGQQPRDQGGRCLPPLMAVLQQAGCSTDMIVGLALQVEQSSVEFEKAVMVYTQFIEAHEKLPGLLQDRQPQQLGRFALLHKLTSSTLLQLAPGLASCDLPRLRCCSKCCVAAFSGLQQAQRLEQLQAQGSSNTGDSGNTNKANSSNADQHASIDQQQGLNYSSCLQSAQDLLQKLLQLWGSATAVLTAADAQTDPKLPNSSSSSGGSSNDQASVQAVLQGADGPVVLRCISCTINVLSASLLPLLFRCHAAEQSAQGANGGGGHALTAVRLCSLLSQQTRMSIEAVQVSGSSSTVALRQSGHLLASTLQAAAADLLHALQGTAEVLHHLGETFDASFHPDSPEQWYVFDLLCSLLKLCCLDSNLLQQQPGFSVAGILRLIRCVAVSASNCADSAATNIKNRLAAAQAAAACADPQTAGAATTQAGSVTASGAAAAAPPAEPDTAAAAAQGSSTCCPDPTAMLPWLVLLGRCCLLWARWLQQLSAVDVAAAQQQLAEQQASEGMEGTWDVMQEAAAAADPWSMLPGQRYTTHTPADKLHCVDAGSGGTQCLHGEILATVVISAGMWLDAGSNMQQLADLGYNHLQPLQEALGQLCRGAASIKTADDDLTEQQPRTDAQRAAAEAILIAERTSVIGLCPQLQAVGEALTAFAFPLSCNNPSCVNASGPSEARLVGGKACVCGGCLTARYCSRACLKQHWKVHKPVCKALAAAGDGRAPAAVNTPASG